MSVTIRLAKVGKRNAPTYKVVVANTRDKRNGKFIDIIGNYNPALKKDSLTLNKDKLMDWIGKGAITSKAVSDLVDGKYTYVKYNPNAKEEAPAAEATSEQTA